MNHSNQSHAEFSGIEFLTVEIEPNDGPAFTANVLDATGFGMAVAVPAAHSSSLGLSEEVNTHIKLGGEPLTVAGIVRSIVDAESFVRYGIEFTAPSEIHDGDASAFVHRLFERRVSHRVEFPEREAVAARLVDAEGERSVEGRLCDVSASGAAVDVPLMDAVGLRGVERAILEFQLPGERSRFALESIVQHLRPTGASTLFALEFVGGSSRGSGSSLSAILDFVSRRVTEVRSAS